MAAPTTNFTDPTTLLRECPMDLRPIIRYEPLKITSCMTRYTEIRSFGYVGRLIWPVLHGMGKESIKVVTQKLPKPPVGKMFINTFPPIYKERVNTLGIADTPRIFPTIFTMHKNN